MLKICRLRERENQKFCGLFIEFIIKCLGIFTSNFIRRKPFLENFTIFASGKSSLMRSWLPNGRNKGLKIYVACSAFKRKIARLGQDVFVECQEMTLKKEKQLNVSHVGVRDVLVEIEWLKNKNRMYKYQLKLN